VNGCPRAEDLYLYLEGELGPYEARKIEEHVEACAGCLERLEERRLLHEAFATLPPFEVPADFARSVMEALPEPGPARGVWLGPLLAGAAALIIALLGFQVFTGQSLSGLLVAFNRFLGSGITACLPAAAKLFKITGLLLKVAADIAGMILDGAGAVARFLGPQGIAAIVGLGGLLVLLAWFGARRFNSPGERS
jgi:hypothetical protein